MLNKPHRDKGQCYELKKKVYIKKEKFSKQIDYYNQIKRCEKGSNSIKKEKKR